MSVSTMEGNIDSRQNLNSQLGFTRVGQQEGVARIPPHSQLQLQVDEDQCLSAQTMAECFGTCEAGSRLDPRVTRKRACVWDTGFSCPGTFAVGCGWCWLCMKQVGADARGHVQGWQGGQPVLFLAPDAVIHRAAGCLLPSKKVSRVCRHQQTSRAPGGLGAGFIEPGDPAHHRTTNPMQRSASHPPPGMSSSPVVVQACGALPLPDEG